MNSLLTLWDAVLAGAALAGLTMLGFGLWKLCLARVHTRRRRRALGAAHRLLQAERPNDDQMWSMDDWDWALSKLGTPEAGEHMRLHNKLRGSRPWLQLVR